MSEHDIIKGLQSIADYLGVSRETVKVWIKKDLPEARAFRKMVGSRFAFKADLDAIKAGKPEKIEA